MKRSKLISKAILLSFFLALFAFNTSAQKVTLSFQKVTLETVLNSIKEQTGLPIILSEQVVDLNRNVSINVKSLQLEVVLQQLLAGTTVGYEIKDNKVYLIEKKSVGTGRASGKSKKVSGLITDINGLPVIGASVKLNDSQTGTITDVNGNFIIEASDHSTLTISYIGYLSENIKVGERTNLSISLKEDSRNLNEVVVVGYGTQKKSDITGSVSSVKTKDLEKSPTFRADQAIQGRIAGVNIQNNDAAPNSNTVIRIRGANSINGGNDPLVVIDGFQGGSLNTLNQNDIESIEVLKDASATAIYGSRGANGVILVTTKKGKSGKPVFTYNSFFTANQLRKKLSLLNAEHYAQSVNDNRLEFGLPTVFSDSQIADFKNNGGTDWQDAIFRTGITNNHMLTASGGSDNISYYVSGNYLNNNGIMKNSSYNRYSLRSNLNLKVNKKLNLGFNTYLSQETDHPTTLNTFAGQNSGSPLFSALVWAPVKKIVDEFGNYTQPGGGYGPNTNYNPVALATEPIRDYFTNTKDVSGNIDYAILESLKLTIFGAYRNKNKESNDYFNSKPTNAPGSEIASVSNDKYTSLQNTNMLTYEKAFDKHNLKFTGVLEQQYELSSGANASSIGFSTDAVKYNNLSLGANPQIPWSFRTDRALLSYMARINYGFDSRYLLTLTARADGSSVFGENNKWGYFPSAAFGWNISNEEFMQRITSIVSNLKFRASVGVVGNQAISPYQSLASLNTNYQYPINGINLSSGVGLGGVANPNLKWEKTNQSNVGFDLEFLKGRINIVADYYYKLTSDLLLSVPLPMIAGGSGNVLKNVGSVENKGFEVYMGGKPLVKTLNWETGFSFSMNKNQVLGLFDGQNEILLGNPGLPGFTKSVWLEIGQPLGLFRGYKYLGVWKSAEASTASIYGAVPGDSKYADINLDGKIDDADIVNIGNAQPKFVCGFNNTFSFKNFDLNIFMNAVIGNSIYNLSRVRMESSGSDGDATSTKILNRWTPQNENTDVPSFKGSNDGKSNSSRWLEDGSYLRIKNISLGYNFQPALLNKIKLTSARIYLCGTNLITLTKYSGFDPEVSVGVDSNAGVDLASYPSQKSVTIGLDIKF